jgi:hypothetical protein
MPWERKEGARRVAKDTMVNVRSLLPALHAELEGLCARDKHRRSTMMDLADALKKSNACRNEWDKAAVHTICVAAQAAGIIEVTTGHTGYSANCYFKSSRNPPPPSDLWVGLPDFEAALPSSARSAVAAVARTGLKRPKRESSFEDKGDLFVEVSSDTPSSDDDIDSSPRPPLTARTRGDTVAAKGATANHSVTFQKREWGGTPQVLNVESEEDDDAPLSRRPVARAAAGAARRPPVAVAAKGKCKFSISDDDEFDL